MAEPRTKQDLDRLCIDTVRMLAIDAIEQASSGHPGLPLGAAPMAHVLWDRFLVHDPAQPQWPDRDRFVLSAGHGSMLLYALLHLSGYDLPLEELKRFRQWGARTPGHPEFGLTAGVEATTGPLGQGSANAVGMAVAERYLARLFNRPGHTVVDHRTYALVSDGDLMEGVSAEAGSLAGFLGLGKLTYLYDANDVSLDGPTSMTFDSEDVAQRYEAYGWHVLRVDDGDHDLDGLDAALRAAREETERPTLIVVKTTIGYGSPNKAGKSAAHGAPLGAEEAAATKRALGWEATEPFAVPEAARDHYRRALDRGRSAREDWEARFAAWSAEHPELGAQWQLAQSGLLPSGWNEELVAFEAGKAVATRDAGGQVLSALAARIPWLWGGDADLGGSTKTPLKGEADFSGRGDAHGRNLRYGVREHAMAAIANGIAYHGGTRHFVATFFCFADYMRPSIRLAAMNELPVVYVFTHDSLAVGEDGPTHQPVEHLMSLRVIPNLVVLRPGDAEETRRAWEVALARTEGPTALVLTRQKLPQADRATLGSVEGVARGAYVLADADRDAQVVLIATGSEVPLALEAQRELAEHDVAARVVSMPSFELFARQEREYRDEVLPPGVPRVSIEAGATLGWERWIGDAGLAIGVDRFGASAPGEEVLERYGFEAGAVAERVRTHLATLR